MKYFKQLLAALLTSSMVLTAVPAFAATSAPANDLNDLGLLLNISQAELNAELTRAIGIAMIMKSLGYSQSDADAKAEDCTFADMDAHAWAKGFVALAYEKGITTGKVDGIIFDPSGTMTKKELIAFQLRALGYDTAKAWTEAKTLAIASGIASGVDDTRFIKSEAAEIMYAALNAEVQGEATSRKLIDKLVAEGVVDEAKAVAKQLVAGEFKITSIEPMNLIQFKVTFNKAIKSAGDKSNYSVSDDATYLDTGAEFVLSDDEKSVVVTMAKKLDNQSKVDIKVTGIENANGDKIEETTENIEFLDMTIPEVESAEVVGKDTIKVMFSEPMDKTIIETKANYEVEEGRTNIKSVKAQKNNTEALVELYSDLSEGTMDIKISNAKDLAGYTAPTKTLEVTVAVDEEAPALVGYKDAKVNSVTLLWSEDIEAVATVLKDSVYHTNTSSKADSVTIDGKEMKITFAKGFEMPEGIAYVYVADEAVSDLWDNKNTKQVVKLEGIEVDKTAPEFVSIEVKDQTTVELLFDEVLTAVSSSKITLLDDKGEKAANTLSSATIVADDNSENKKLKLAYNTADGEGLYGDYTIVIEGGLKDASDNETAKMEIDVHFDDETAPVVGDFASTLYFDGKDTEMLLVEFKDEMVATGVNSPLNLDNWVIDNKSLSDISADVSIDFVRENKAVEIRVAKDKLNLSTSSVVQVARLADAAGNTTNALSTTIPVTASSTVGIASAEITDDKTVVVTFADYLKTFDNDDVYVTTDGTTASAIAIAKVGLSESSDGHTVATFTIDTTTASFTADAKYQTNDVTVVIAGAPTSENNYGEKVTADATSVAADKYSVAIAKADNVDGTSVDKVTAVDKNTITIEFTEAVDTTTVSRSTFTVDGGNITVSSIAWNTAETIVTLTLADSSSITAGSDLVGKAIKQSSAIEDKKGNQTTDISTEVGNF